MESSKLSKLVQVMVIIVVVGLVSYFAMQKFEMGAERLNFGKTISLNNINIPINTDSLIMAVKAKIGVVQDLAVGDDKAKLEQAKQEYEAREKQLSDEQKVATERYIVALDRFYKSEDDTSIKSALKTLQENAGKTIDPVFAYSMLGWAHTRSLNAKDAVAAFRSSSSLQPDNVDLKMNLVRALLQTRQLEEAAKLVEDVLKVEADNKMAQTIKAQLARIRK